MLETLRIAIKDIRNSYLASYQIHLIYSGTRPQGSPPYNKTCKSRYVGVEETLTVSKVSNLIAEKEGTSREEGKTPAKRVRTERRCGYYSKIRHNSRTYKVEIEDVDNSNASK
jgi:hypothetical protein